MLNAVAHKDYSAGSPIQISVYSDKLIFWNEAQLPQSWSVQKLLHKHPSKPFNPDIANALFRSGYIESWGRGTLKIMKECFQNGNPKPKFNFEDDGFTVEFYSKTSAINHAKVLLNERQKDALMNLKHKKTIANQEYAERYGITDRTARRDLSEMVDLGWLTREGEGKQTHYHFTTQTLNFGDEENYVR